MTRRTAAVMTAVLLGLLAATSVAAPAAATSCVAAPASPIELLGGTPLYGNARLFDAYDYALAGTVLEVRPAPGGSATSGPQFVDIDVLAAFNRAWTPRHVTLRMRDRGELQGYPFDVGQRYFVAVKDAAVGLCSPTTPLATVDAEFAAAVDRLRSAATAAGIPVFVPADATIEATPLAAQPTQVGAGPPFMLVAVGAVLALAVLAVAVLGSRHRHPRRSSERAAP